MREITGAVPALTDFQKAILWAAEREPNGHASAWVVAQKAFPEKWAKRSARGALVAHIRRAACKMKDLCCVLPPDGRHGDYTICVYRSRT